MSALAPVFDAAWAWLVFGALAMLLELLLAGVFLFWLGLGAAVTGLVLLALPELSLGAQITVFIVAMFAAIGLGIKVTRRQKQGSKAAMLNQGMQALVGHTAVAVDVFVQGRGRIRVQDTTYQAQWADFPTGEDSAQIRVREIQAGELVEIVGVAGGFYQVQPSRS